MISHVILIMIHHLQMNSLLIKIQQAAQIVEQRPLDTLDYGIPYSVIKLIWTPTKYGPAVQAHLQEMTDGQPIETQTFRVFLPKRISNVLTEEDTVQFNNSNMVYTLVYRGKVGNMCNVDFY